MSGAHLYILDGSTRQLRAVPVPAGEVPGDPGWSHDGHWLAFGTHPAPGTQSPGAAGGVWVLGAEQGAPHRVMAGSEGYEWSPTADQLALGGGDSAPGQTVVLDPASGRSVTIPCRCATAWSPDGNTLATVTTTRSPDAEGGFTWGSELGMVPAAGGAVRVWYRESGDTLQLLGWWPNGQGVLFWRDPENSASLAADGLELDALGPGQSTPKPVATTLTDRHWAAWSPDHQTLALVAGGNRVVWSGKSLALCQPERPGGCTPVPVEKGFMALDPAWAPGGALAFVRAAADFGGSAPTFGAEPVAGWYGTRTLWSIDQPGDAAHPISAAGTGVAAPTWSKDGRFIVFVRDDALWLVGATGGPAARVAGPLYGGQRPDDYLDNNYYGDIPWNDQFAWFG